jgi:hypothetical protein
MLQNETDGCQYPANLRKSLAQLIEIKAAKWNIEVKLLIAWIIS